MLKARNETISIKEQILYILDFGDHKISVTATQLYYYNEKANVDKMES
jgi:hypothetical protein